MLLIKNGRVLDPASNTDAPKDVLLEDSCIKEIAPTGKLSVDPGVETFDATG
jgi:dihydroorotase-like cyclic amidohydrolase